MVGFGFLAKWVGVSRRRRSAEWHSQLEADEHPPESDTRSEEKDESTKIVAQIPTRDEHSSIQESNPRQIWFQIAYEAGTRITKAVKMGIGYFKLEDELESEARSLPEELVMEILACTAFKTLLRCRCVCRKWNSLISEPSFVKIHLLNNHNTTNNDEKVGDYMIFSNKKSGPQTFSFYDGCVGKRIEFPKISYGVRHSLPYGVYCLLIDHSSFSKFELVGCCNGLLCLLSRKGAVFLWNPALKKVRFVEETEMSPRCFGGLSFDPQTMEFKVITISIGHGLKPPDVRIYSTSRNLWKIAAHNDSRHWRIQQKCPAPFVKGALHWYAERQGQVILCFDVSEEAFREINVPSFKTMARVKEFQGTIACFLDDQNDQSWEVWVMKEYGVEDSWAKLYTIGYSHGSPLEIMNDGEVMLIGANGEFLLFDPTTENQGRKVDVEHGGKDMVSYKGSLAMLNEGNQSRFFPLCGSAYAMVVWYSTLLWFGFQLHSANSTERSTTGSEC